MPAPPKPEPLRWPFRLVVKEPVCPYCKTATRYGEACRACSVPGGPADQHLKELRERKAEHGNPVSIAREHEPRRGA